MNARADLPERSAAGAEYLVDLIARKTLLGKVDENNFTRLHAKFLNAVLGWRNQPAIVQYVIDKGYVERDPRYVPGQSSKGFRLTPETCATLFEVIDVREPRMLRQVEQAYGPVPALTKTHKHLRKHVAHVRCTDLARALHTIRTNEQLNRYFGLHARVTIDLSAGRLHLGRCGPDRFGRFHTPISRLPRELRPFLSIGREPLWSIDVRNAQPLLVALAYRLYAADPTRFDADRFGVGFGESTYLLAPGRSMHTDGADAEAEQRKPIMIPQIGEFSAQPDYWSILKRDLEARHGMPTTRAVPEQYPDAGVTHGALHERYAGQRAESDRLATGGRQNGDRDNAVTMSGIRRTSAGCPQDVRTFIDVCERGRFYEHLMGLPALASVLPHDPAEARNQIKTDILAVFFDDPSKINRRQRPERRALNAAIAAEFPTIHGFLCQLKSGQREDGRGYANAACTCQNLEASIVIGGVCGRLMAERPAMPVLTIHDSLLVPESAVPYVEAVIRDEFGKWGLSPSLKSEPVAPASTAAAVA